MEGVFRLQIFLNLTFGILLCYCGELAKAALVTDKTSSTLLRMGVKADRTGAGSAP
ncbi:MAG: hypothetical protein JO015_04990 [Verrucomicrobia bacterium]|nr:hypothetical protein [Verrucomicrobiota bacterium]